MSEPEKAYPAGMSAKRFKELTTPWEATRFGKKFPVPAAYSPEDLLKKLQELESKGKTYEEHSSAIAPDMFEPDDYGQLKDHAMYPIRTDSTGRDRCLFCGHYKDYGRNSVAPDETGK